MLVKQIPLLAKARLTSLDILSAARLQNSIRIAKEAKNPLRSFMRIKDIIQQDFDFRSDFNARITEELES